MVQGMGAVGIRALKREWLVMAWEFPRGAAFAKAAKKFAVL